MEKVKRRVTVRVWLQSAEEFYGSENTLYDIIIMLI